LRIEAEIPARLPSRFPSRLHGSAIVIGLIVTALTVVAAWALGLHRRALWPVVRTCVATYKLSGSPFPCLKVDLEGGEGRGYVVLRPPIGDPDTILAPTRRITGVEDPFLQSSDAPNYFAEAWAARRFLGEAGEGPSPARVGLVVNSAYQRSQDQLHIHIGCVAPEFGEAVRAIAAAAPAGLWISAGRLLPGFWALRTGRSDLAEVEPFRLAAEAFAGDARRRANLTIAVVNAPDGGRNDFVILTTRPGSGAWWPPGADELLDLACREEPRLGD
jgi:CDP-diacylglycerol pyrophosphatase